MAGRLTEVDLSFWILCCFAVWPSVGNYFTLPEPSEVLYSLSLVPLFALLLLHTSQFSLSLISCLLPYLPLFPHPGSWEMLYACDFYDHGDCVAWDPGFVSAAVALILDSFLSFCHFWIWWPNAQTSICLFGSVWRGQLLCTSFAHLGCHLFHLLIGGKLLATLCCSAGMPNEHIIYIHIYTYISLTFQTSLSPPIPPL